MELCIGTIQLGMQHGISHDQEHAQGARELLEYAADHGISTIDTASAYGEAEKVVGDFIRHYGRAKLKIITKIRPGLLFNIQPKNYVSIIQQNIEDSLTALNLAYVDACVFHDAEYVGNQQALAALAQMKDMGLAQKTGMAINLPAEFEQVMASPYVDLIQIPYNILDRRLDGLLKQCTQEIHARGVFLQGLLLMDEQEIPQKLWGIKPYLHAIDAFAERNGLSRMQILLGYVKLQTQIDKVIVGMESKRQVRRVMDAFVSEVDGATLRDLAESLNIMDERLIMPNLWHGEYK